jgi:hypothetical protein
MRFRLVILFCTSVFARALSANRLLLDVCLITTYFICFDFEETREFFTKHAPRFLFSHPILLCWQQPDLCFCPGQGVVKRDSASCGFGGVGNR